jgi:hypothetical protein
LSFYSDLTTKLDLTTIELRTGGAIFALRLNPIFSKNEKAKANRHR